MLTEFKLIDRLKKQLDYKRDVFKGIGDDCAVIKEKKSYRLYTADNFVEGVHFDLKYTNNFKKIGFKAISRAVSDIAAMGGTPRYLLVCLAISSKLTQKGFNKLVKGFKDACNFYNVDIIGGDITSSSAVTITITCIGESDTKPVLRSGAKEGNHIYLTGETGLAKGGLELLKRNKKACKKLIDAYESPTARIELGSVLRKNKIATAMIDISDGLLGDLKHILEESGKGAVIELKNIPLSSYLTKNFSYEESLDFVLNGGDDYELIFTANKNAEEKVSKISQSLNIAITKIGEVTNHGFFIKHDKKLKLKSRSYEHVFI